MRLRNSRRSLSERSWLEETLSGLPLGLARGASFVVDFYRLHLRQVVAIHQAMFQKLLFEEESAVGLELAELFNDVGKTYLQIAERINENCFNHSLQD
jgi:hypothetical protein